MSVKRMNQVHSSSSPGKRADEGATALGHTYAQQLLHRRPPASLDDACVCCLVERVGDVMMV